MKPRIFGLLIGLLVLTTAAWGTGGSESVEPTGAAAAPAGMYEESPLLTARVAAGELPPVDDRLPANPMIAETIEEVGAYGGDINVFAIHEGRLNDMQNIWGSTLFRLPRNAVGIDPNVAEGYDISEDGTIFTLYLREGLKWSDGEPLTTEDLRFAFEDMHWNDKVNTWNRLGMVKEIEVVDDYTIRLIAPGGIGLLPIYLSDWPGGVGGLLFPAHYLKRWHMDYNPDAQKLAEEEGQENWYDAMRLHYWWDPQRDTDLPGLNPWILSRLSTTLKVFERNPYFWKVDEAGNQLPYIDRVTSSIVSEEVYQLKVSSGEADIAYIHTQFENIPLYKSNEETGEFRTILFPGGSGSYVSIWINQNHPDPGLRSIYNNVKFRQALSAAIDREDINEAVYMGLGVPRQLAPLPGTSFYREDWGEYCAEYDPGLANRLLDEVGLDEKDGSGHRLGPDGKALSLVIEYPIAGQTTALEVVREYWEEVGLKTTVKLEEWGLLLQNTNTSNFFAYTHTNPNQPWSIERKFFQFSHVWRVGVAAEWEAWLSAKQKAVEAGLEEGAVLPADWIYTETDAELEGEKPDDWWLEQENLRLKWAATEMGSAEYMSIGRELFDVYVKKIIKLGLVGQVPDVMIAKNGLGNVVPPKWVTGYPLDPQLIQEWYDQLFWKE